MKIMQGIANRNADTLERMVSAFERLLPRSPAPLSAAHPGNAEDDEENFMDEDL